jgi:transcriptional regulator with PAS, ATPase and Fis domain
MKTRSDILDRCLELIRREIPSDWASLYMGEDRQPPVLCRSNPPEHAEALEAGKAYGPCLISSMKALFTSWIPAQPLPEGGGMRQKRFVLGLPLVFGLGRKAVVLLGRGAFSGDYAEADLRLLRVLAAPLRQILHSFAPEGERVPNEHGKERLLGKSPGHERVLQLIQRVKDFDTPVFIAGESGTGKELVAKTIHFGGRRCGKPFVAVNCCAIPENLLESELFGYVRGAFTGAFKDKEGLIEEARGGTFFLDEVGDLPLHLQAKLLRLLQEREIRRVGENRPRQVDVRFVSATHRNIEDEVSRWRFRKDLYFRLKIIAIHLPPLRERRQDIPLLLGHYLERYSHELGRRPCPSLAPQAVKCLIHYDWPGNIRELQNEIQRCLILSGAADTIVEGHLSSRIRDRRDGVEGENLYGFFRARADFERNFIREALYSCGFHRERTAAKIGLSRQGLYKLIKKHKISLDEESRGQIDPNIIDQSEIFC